MKASKLEPRQKATITQINDNELISKFIEMGLFAGQTIELLYKAPFKGPSAYKVGNYILALRENESAFIEVNID